MQAQGRRDLKCVSLFPPEEALIIYVEIVLNWWWAHKQAKRKLPYHWIKDSCLPGKVHYCAGLRRLQLQSFERKRKNFMEKKKSCYITDFRRGTQVKNKTQKPASALGSIVLVLFVALFKEMSLWFYLFFHIIHGLLVDDFACTPKSPQRHCWYKAHFIERKWHPSFKDATQLFLFSRRFPGFFDPILKWNLSAFIPLNSLHRKNPKVKLLGSGVGHLVHPCFQLL